MKKLLLLTTIMLIQVCLFGQALPNGTFENWNSINYNELSGWNSGNLRDIQRMGVPSVTRVTGLTGYGIRIQTNIIGADTSDSYIINTNNPCSDPSAWTGGTPLTQQPTAITGYYRYNLLGTDTAIMLVIFRKNGVHIGDNFIKIRGTGNQSTFVAFSFPVTCAGVPDSVIIAAAPSNKKDNNIATNGSFIEFDNLGFTGTTQTPVNANFENWIAKSYDAANGWEVWGNGVSKSTSSYAGTYAMRIETVNEMCGDVYSSGITTGHLTENSGPKGGRPYTNMLDTLKGYYKYTSMGNDTANISINLSKTGSNVGGGWKQLPASANYTYFEIPINAFMAPDTMRIDIQSSKWPTQPSNVGSVLFLDNLYLSSLPLGLFNSANNELKIIAYPNPVHDILHIKINKNVSVKNIIIYDALGNIVKTQNNIETESNFNIDVSKFATGVYYYSVQTNDGNTIRNKFIVD